MTILLLLSTMISPAVNIPAFAQNPASLVVKSTNIATNNEIQGLYASIYNSTNHLVASGFTPLSYNLASSGTYNIDFSNYGSYYFTSTNATSNYHVIDWGGRVSVALNHTTNQVVHGFYFHEQSPGEYVKMTIQAEDMDSEELSMFSAVKRNSTDALLTQGFSPYTVGVPGDTGLKVVWNNYGPYFYTESIISPNPPAEELRDNVETWGGVQRIYLPITNTTTSYSDIAVYGPEEEALANEYLEIISELDQIGMSLNETSITPELVSHINSTLIRLEETVIDLQNLGYDGIANATRIGQEMVGIVKFYDENTSELLFEKQIPNGTLGIFAVMGMSKEFAAAGDVMTFEELADILPGSLVLAQAITNLEDDERASDFVLASIGAFHPSTGHTFFIIPIAVTEIIAWCISTPACVEAVAVMAEYLLSGGIDEVFWGAFYYLYPAITVEGILYNDINRNGIRDDPVQEFGLDEWSVALTTFIGLPILPVNNIELSKVLTNPEGEFVISGVHVPRSAEKIIVIETLEEGWEAATAGGEIQEIDFVLPFDPEPLSFGNAIMPTYYSHNLSNNNGTIHSADIEVNGDSVYAVWSDTTPGDNTILFRKSTNKGASFSSTITLSTNGTDVSPQLAYSGSNVYAVWHDAYDGEVYLARSTNNGTSFSSAVNLSNDVESSINAKIIASGDDVYIIWEGDEFIFVKSSNGGSTFGSKIDLGQSADFPRRSQMKKDGDNLYFIWSGVNATLSSDSNTYFRRSTNNGDTFSTAFCLNPGSTNTSGQSSIAVSGSSVFIAWTEIAWDSEAVNVFMRNSTNNGASFASAVNMSTLINEDSHYAKIEALGNNVHLVWQEDKQIRYRNSINGGVTWGNGAYLSGSLDNQLTEPLISVTSEHLDVMWNIEDTQTNLNEVHLRKSIDSGGSFSNVVNISNTPNNESRLLAMVASGNSLYLLYEDTAGNPTGDNFDLYFKARHE